ncbi:MAG: thiamine phosphate synthase [Hyphomicrobiaceae bacterium]
MAKIEPVGLYLIVEAMPGPSVQERLKAALTATKFASALVCAPQGQTLDAATARPFVELIQAQDVAALIDNDAQLARTLRADGVHLRAGDNLEARASEAREILGARYIIGGEAATRHDAMMLGEHGAEYIAFNEPDQADFVEWWAQIFEVPCVALDLATPQDATTMASLGADFVAFRLISAGTPGDAQDSARSFADAAAVGLHEFASRAQD